MGRVENHSLTPCSNPTLLLMSGAAAGVVDAVMVWSLRRWPGPAISTPDPGRRLDERHRCGGVSLSRWDIDRWGTRMSQTKTVPLAGDAEETRSVGSPGRAETIIATFWGESGMGCAGCGQAAVTIDRVVAVDDVRNLPRRFAALLDHSDAELSRRVEGQVWSALESVEHAADVLGAANNHLALFTAVDGCPRPPGLVRVELVPPGSNGKETMRVLAALSASAAGQSSLGYGNGMRVGPPSRRWPWSWGAASSRRTGTSRSPS